jgi:hypothetical protein
VIEDEEVIKKILKHLGLWERKARPPPKATIDGFIQTLNIRKLSLPDFLKMTTGFIGQVCPDFINFSTFIHTLPCLTSSSLSHSFDIFCQLNSTTIWWGDFLLTHNAELHMLHSSKREFLSTYQLYTGGHCETDNSNSNHIFFVFFLWHHRFPGSGGIY